MKKIIDFTTLAFLAAAAAGMVAFLDVERDMTTLFSDVMRKIAPWVHLHLS